MPDAPSGDPTPPPSPPPTTPTWNTPAPTKEPETTPPPPVPTEKNPEETEAPIDDKEFPQTATLLQSVTAYNADKSATHTVSAGSTLRVAARAEGEWWKARSGNETVWLHLDEPDGISVETPTGWLMLWVAMDGLDYNL